MCQLLARPLQSQHKKGGYFVQFVACCLTRQGFICMGVTMITCHDYYLLLCCLILVFLVEGILFVVQK